MRGNDWRAAAQRWTALRQLYPDEPPPWVQGAIALHWMERTTEARALLTEARQRFPSNPNAWVEGAEVLAKEGDTNAAQTLLEQARQRFPDDIGVWLKSADIALRSDDAIAAQGFNDHARKHFPEKAGGFIQRANLAMRVQNWSAACDYWRDVRERFPGQRAGYMQAAEALEQLGEPRRARRLRLAWEYGKDWLHAAESDDGSHANVAPMMRRDVLRFLELVWTKARFNLKSEANRDQLHYLWWFIEPLMFMAVYYVVFALLLHSGGDNYVPYLLSGVMPFQWFAKTVANSSNSIVQGRGLMQSVRVSPLFFPLAALLQNSSKQIPIFGLLAFLMILTGRSPTLHWLALAPIILLQMFFLGVLCCLLAMLIPFFRDLNNLVPIGVRFVLFASGVFYTLDTIPDRWLGLFLANPMANLLYQYRLILVEGRWPDWAMCGWLLLACVLASLVVWWLYRRLESVFPRVVIE